MIKTARQLKDLIRNLSREKSADAQLLMRNFKQFFDLTLCNSANGGKACVYRLSRHLLYGKTTRI